MLKNNNNKKSMHTYELESEIVKILFLAIKGRQQASINLFPERKRQNENSPVIKHLL